jgi:hypothetical protein
MAKRYSQRFVQLSNETQPLIEENKGELKKNTDEEVKPKEEGVELTRVNLSEGPDPKLMVLKVVKRNETVGF